MILATIAGLIIVTAPVKCTITDGDTIRCASERIRLTGIDAPELRGHCRPGRDCVPGDPIASRESLRRFVIGKTLTIRRLGRDRYGRTLAVVYADGINIACHQLRTGHAEYRAKWDNGSWIRKDCR